MAFGGERAQGEGVQVGHVDVGADGPLPLRDGLIVHPRDYNNPLAMAAAMEMTPEQLSALLGQEA